MNLGSERATYVGHEFFVFRIGGDETVAYLVSRRRMEAIAETLELLANPEAMKAIRAHQVGKMKFFPLSSLGNAR